MNICMVSSDFLPYPGGIANHVYELSKALVSECNKVWVVASNPHHQTSPEILDGICVHRIDVKPIRRTMNVQFFIKAGLLLKTLVKREQIDVVHCHSLYPDTLATKFFTPKDTIRIFTNHSSGFLEMAQNKRLHPWLKFQIADNDKIIAPSKELCDITALTGIDNEKIIYIPNGVDTIKFSPQNKGDKIRKRYGISSDELVILSARRFVHKNGVIYLAKAAPIVVKHCPQVKFLLVGDGPEMSRIRNQVLSDNVENYVLFTGMVPNSEMPEYMTAANIVVLPSLMEATSITGLEAMASGKPLVGTNVGGIPEIVDDGVTGILVPPKNPIRLADAIIDLVSSASKRCNMGINARKRALNEFSWKTIAQQTMSVYKNRVGV